MGTYTDPTRAHATDAGHIEGNMVFTYLDFFGEKEKVDEMKNAYTKGQIADVEVKQYLYDALITYFKDARNRYDELKNNPDLVKAILSRGKEKAMMIDLKSVLNKRRINLGGHARIVFERVYFLLRELCSGAKQGNLFRCFEGSLSFSAANIYSQIPFFAADGFFESCGQNSGESRGVPIKSEHCSECLKPNRIGDPLHKLIRPIFGDNDSCHLPSQFHHPLKQPFGALAIIESECCNSALEHTITISLFLNSW